MKYQVESKIQKKEARDREKEVRFQKLAEIKEEIQKAREGDKDVLFTKINEKIEGL